MSDLVHERPKSSTSPRAAGACSNTIVLPDEDRAEWEALRAHWLYEYESTNPILISLAEQAALAEWFLRRANRRYHQTEQKLYADQPDFTLWTNDQHKKFERALRYRTTQERCFHRASTDLEKLQKSHLKACRELAILEIEHEQLLKEKEAHEKTQPEPHRPVQVPEPRDRSKLPWSRLRPADPVP